MSHSEAEETNSEEDDSLGEPSLAESLRKDEASMTPKGPSPSLVTPIASPVAKKKVIEEPKEAEKKAQTAEEFIQKHCDVEMKPGSWGDECNGTNESDRYEADVSAVIEARVLQPAASAMANLLKMTNFTTKISDALLKKKVPSFEKLNLFPRFRLNQKPGPLSPRISKQRHPSLQRSQQLPRVPWCLGWQKGNLPERRKEASLRRLHRSRWLLPRRTKHFRRQQGRRPLLLPLPRQLTPFPPLQSKKSHLSRCRWSPEAGRLFRGPLRRSRRRRTSGPRPAKPRAPHRGRSRP